MLSSIERLFMEEGIIGKLGIRLHQILHYLLLNAARLVTHFKFGLAQKDLRNDKWKKQDI